MILSPIVILRSNHRMAFVSRYFKFRWNVVRSIAPEKWAAINLWKRYRFFVSYILFIISYILLSSLESVCFLFHIIYAMCVRLGLLINTDWLNRHSQKNINHIRETFQELVQVRLFSMGLKWARLRILQIYLPGMCVVYKLYTFYRQNSRL